MTAKLKDVVVEMVQRAQDADHRTVWLRGAKTDEGEKVFVFMTWFGENAERAEAL